MEKSFDEKENIRNELEKNIKILTDDLNTMLDRIKKGMTKLSTNNFQISELYKNAVIDYTEDIKKCQACFLQILKECDKLQDSFVQIEILSQKM